MDQSLILHKTAAFALSLAVTLSQPPGLLHPDPQISCDLCPTWNGTREPFQVFGNTHYVGTAGLSSILITSAHGHILIDGGLPQSAALIDEHIRHLGFRTEDIRLILNSHPHFDHAGGIAALQRVSGARVAASAPSARAIQQGGPTEDDPQFAFGGQFPRVASVRVIKDGEILRVADLAVTAHLTPGHTPGGTTWTWRSCVNSRCLSIVYADSLNPISASGFRFTGDDQHPSIAQTFRESIALVEHLPCDILISVHPEFSDIDRKLKGRAQGDRPDPFIDPSGCRMYAARAMQLLDRRIAQEGTTRRTSVNPRRPEHPEAILRHLMLRHFRPSFLPASKLARASRRRARLVSSRFAESIQPM